MSREEELKKEAIKIIHTLKFNIFEDDGDRREFMFFKWGKNSLKEFTIAELREFVDIVGGKLYGAKKKEKATKDQLNLINALWLEVSNSKSPLALRKFIGRVLKEKSLIMYLNYLSKTDAGKVIMALRKWKNQKENA